MKLHADAQQNVFAHKAMSKSMRTVLGIHHDTINDSMIEMGMIVQLEQGVCE